MNLEGEEMPFDFKKEYKEFYKLNGYLFAGKWVCEWLYRQAYASWNLFVWCKKGSCGKMANCN